MLYICYIYIYMLYIYVIYVIFWAWLLSVSFTASMPPWFEMLV